ncbi:hypothetical protein L915_16842 [Phytophthora nicotianae]|uniref:Uncharacterized protein n=1 Tax=Phytophthora nicotianae TaxID=4792 RepID=W2G3N9_PHYNI|nr:hypothetical protein L915_16842 [Phytophthora nicotianae]
MEMYIRKSWRRTTPKRSNEIRGQPKFHFTPFLMEKGRSCVPYQRSNRRA